MMDEAIGWSRRVTRGIDVNEETLAVNVIHDVGPNGHYLRHKHTRKFFKTEFWYPNLHDVTTSMNGRPPASRPMRDRTVARVRNISKPITPPPLKPETVG